MQWANLDGAKGKYVQIAYECRVNPKHLKTPQKMEDHYQDVEPDETKNRRGLEFGNVYKMPETMFCALDYS